MWNVCDANSIFVPMFFLQAENLNERKHVRRVPQQAGKIRKNSTDKNDVKISPSPPSHDYVNIRALNASFCSDVNTKNVAKSTDDDCSQLENKKEYKDECVQTNFPFEDPFCSEELRKNWKLMMLRPPSSRDEFGKYSDSGYDTLRPECPSPGRSRVGSPSDNLESVVVERSDQYNSGECCVKHELSCHKNYVKAPDNNDFVVHVSCSVSQGKMNRCVEAVDVYSPPKIFEKSSTNSSFNCKMKREPRNMKHREKFYDDISEVKKYMSACSSKQTKPTNAASEPVLIFNQKSSIKRLEDLTAPLHSIQKCKSSSVPEDKDTNDVIPQNREVFVLDMNNCKTDHDAYKQNMSGKQIDSPPKNIVQERIRIFEAVSTDGKNKDDSSKKGLPTHQSQNSDGVLQIKQLEFNRKRNRKMTTRRQFHSDTEVELQMARLSSEDEDPDSSSPNGYNKTGNYETTASVNLSVDQYKKEMSKEQKQSEEYYLPMGGKFREWLLEKSSSHAAENDEAQYIQMDEKGILNYFTDDEKHCSFKEFSTKCESLPFNNNCLQSDECYDDAQNAINMYEPIYAELNLNHSHATQCITEEPEVKIPGQLMIEATQENDFDHQYENLNISTLLSRNKNKDSDALSSASDADDEASKDLNLPSLSLNDSFRPASYYLKNKTYKKVEQDSSDEDLESPPPIPISPPPIDELACMFLPKHLKAKDDSVNESSTYFSTTDIPLSDDQKKFCGMSGELSNSPLRSNLNYSYYRVYEDDSLYAEATKAPKDTEKSSKTTDAFQDAIRLEDLVENMPQHVFDAYVNQNERRSEMTAESSHNSSNSVASPPYYYSDLRNCVPDFNASLWNQSLQFEQLLNNSRPFSPACSKQDIGRKVNKIQAPTLQVGSPQNVVEELNRSIKLLELKNFSNAEKNVYEADTLKIRRHRACVSLQEKDDPRNMYPFGLRDKTLPSTSEFTAAPYHRRSRSFEGLLNVDSSMWSESASHSVDAVNTVEIDDRNSETNSTQMLQRASPDNSFLGQRNGDLPLADGGTVSETGILSKDIRRISRSLDELDNISSYAEPSRCEINSEKICHWKISPVPLVHPRTKFFKSYEDDMSVQNECSTSQNNQVARYQETEFLSNDETNFVQMSKQNYLSYETKFLERQPNSESSFEISFDEVPKITIAGDPYTKCDSVGFARHKKPSTSYDNSRLLEQHEDVSAHENESAEMVASKRNFLCFPEIVQTASSEYSWRQRNSSFPSDMVAVNHLYKENSESEYEPNSYQQEAATSFMLKNTAVHSNQQSIRFGGGARLVNEDMAPGYPFVHSRKH